MSLLGSAITFQMFLTRCVNRVSCITICITISLLPATIFSCSEYQNRRWNRTWYGKQLQEVSSLQAGGTTKNLSRSNYIEVFSFMQSVESRSFPRSASCPVLLSIKTGLPVDKPLFLNCAPKVGHNKFKHERIKVSNQSGSCSYAWWGTECQQYLQRASYGPKLFTAMVPAI